MIFDAINFYKDNAIYALTTGHKHCRPGWINIPCPFCSGNPGYHLGYQLRDGFFSCWRCGGHGTKKVVKALLSCSWTEAGKAVKRYRGFAKSANLTHSQPRKGTAKKLILPYGCGDLTKVHRRYLVKRGYNPQELIEKWGLMATGHLGPYAFRIIAPIYQYGQLVSYQGRDWTGKAPYPYKACAIPDEVMHHKHCLYGLDNVPGNVAVLVEGIFDAFRLGFGSVASFGIKFKKQQAKKLRRFDKVFVFYDVDPQAIEQAERMGAYLAMYGKSIFTIELNSKIKDPGLLPQKYANDLMKELLQED